MSVHGPIHADKAARLAAAEALLAAIYACHPADAAFIMEDRLRALGAGQPVPPLFGLMTEARDWASFASPSELKAYAVTSFERMAPAVQRDFLSHVGWVA